MTYLSQKFIVFVDYPLDLTLQRFIFGADWFHFSQPLLQSTIGIQKYSETGNYFLGKKKPNRINKLGMTILFANEKNSNGEDLYYCCC